MEATIKYKVCTTCKLTKPLSEFNKDRSTKDGHDCRCRDCSKARNRQYQATHKETCAKAKKRYLEANKEKVAAKQKAYREAHRDELNAKKKIYRQTHPEKIKAYAEAHKEETKAWREAHREQIAKTSKEWREKNKERVIQYYRDKRKNDIQYVKSCNYRRRIGAALRAGSLSKNMELLLGCDFETLKQHLEKQFKPGMTWENYGLKGWQVDHIIPCASFDMTDEKQVAECFYYKNMQPLWSYENQQKSDKLQDGTTCRRRTWQSR